MTNKLDFIKRENILMGIQQIDKGIVPKNNEWSEYWINYKSKLYQFKYVVSIASSFTKSAIKTTDFTSNDSSRNYIASLGFHILFKSPKENHEQINYWVGASYYGLRENQTDMFSDFKKKGYWRTDHDLEKGEGLKVWKELRKVKVNDRICIRYFDKKGNKIHIAAIGTVKNTKYFNDGKLAVVWDYNPPQYKGPKPYGTGSGNWWKTLLNLKRHSDIAQIFGENLIEKRVARLTWNDFGWVMPSGPFGKSEHQDSHEARYGYGHEEWLFDTSKLIKGFHYGFLEPIRKEQSAFSNKVYDVWLYSINGETKKRFWIGNINNLTVIDKEEADEVKQTYVNNNWIEEMEEQIKASGANEKGFSNWKGLDLFNVKFSPNDIFLNDPYFELTDNHPIYEQSRYAFIHFNNEFEVSSTDTDDNFNFTTSTENGDGDNNPKSKIHIRQPKAIEIIYLHRAISNSLTKLLRQNHGKNNVTREHPAGYGANKIDIVVKKEKHLTFYEIKTYNSLKTSVREALGQLMEYGFYPNKRKAYELIIVTQLPANAQTKTYFGHLRQLFNIPIYYQSYNLETETLSEKS